MEAVKSWFKPFTEPEPTNPSWWVEVSGRFVGPPVSREAVQQAQQGIQYANTFLIEKAGLSPAAASAVIGGTLALPFGPEAALLAAAGAYLSTEALETETAQRGPCRA